VVVISKEKGPGHPVAKHFYGAGRGPSFWAFGIERHFFPFALAPPISFESKGPFWQKVKVAGPWPGLY